MDLTGKIGKGILWTGLGYVAWLVFDHYSHVGTPSADPLSNFFVFLAIGGIIYLFDQRKGELWSWLLHGDGQKVLVVIGWAISVSVVTTFFRTPDFIVSAVPFHVPTPLPLVIGAGLFLAYQAYRLIMWVLF